MRYLKRLDQMETTRTLTVEIPLEVYNEIDAVQSLATRRGMILDVNEVVTKSLASILKKVKAELNKASTADVSGAAEGDPTSSPPEAAESEA